MKIGLSLAGGGVKGAAHIGVIKALEEENIKIDYISGSSSGSIVAVLYAIGYTPKQMLEIFNEYASKIKYAKAKNIFKLIWELLIKGKLTTKGLNSGKTIEKLVRKICNEKNIQDIRDISLPIFIPTVDLESGIVNVFSSSSKNEKKEKGMKYTYSGDLAKIVRASCSYPFIFEPCEISSSFYIDGGILENIPWRELKNRGADKIISVIFTTKDKNDCCKNLFSVAQCAFEYLCKELAKYEINGAQEVINIETKKIGLLDSNEIMELYNLGYKEAKQWLTKKQIYD